MTTVIRRWVKMKMAIWGLTHGSTSFQIIPAPISKVALSSDLATESVPCHHQSPATATHQTYQATTFHLAILPFYTDPDLTVGWNAYSSAAESWQMAVLSWQPSMEFSMHNYHYWKIVRLVRECFNVLCDDSVYELIFQSKFMAFDD